MLAIDHNATRLDLAIYVADNLSCDEQTALRAAYGFAPCGEQAHPSWLEGTVTQTVPDAIALPWERSTSREEAA